MSLRDAVAMYERSMRQYGFEAVRESLKQMSASAPIYNPVVGGAVLAAMNGTFRLINSVPPLKRRMARGQTRLRDRQSHPALAAIGC